MRHKLLAPLLAGVAIVALAAIAADPPLPTQVQVRLEWDALPAEQEILGYIVYQAPNIQGPWSSIVTTNGTNVLITMDRPQRMFWYVVASNFWSVGLPSNVVNTPAEGGKVQGVKVTK